jgi:hypothetical protein
VNRRQAAFNSPKPEKLYTIAAVKANRVPARDG